MNCICPGHPQPQSRTTPRSAKSPSSPSNLKVQERPPNQPWSCCPGPSQGAFMSPAAGLRAALVACALVTPANAQAGGRRCSATIINRDNAGDRIHPLQIFPDCLKSAFATIKHAILPKVTPTPLAVQASNFRAPTRSCTCRSRKTIHEIR